MTEFRDTGEFKGGSFTNVDFGGAQFVNANFSGVTIKEGMFMNARLSGFVGNLTVNDIAVWPLIAAELERRHPELAKMQPSEPDGFREAWSIVETLWADTVDRARKLPEARLHERVDGEWSFLETLRHLILVTDAWLRRRMLGLADAHHPMGVCPSFVTEPKKLVDPTLDPDLDEVLEVRRDRMAQVRAVIDGLAGKDELKRKCGEAGENTTVRDCLRTILDEEHAHYRYASRDLSVLGV